MRTCKGEPGAGGELRHSLDEGKPGPDGALGIMFVRLRIAKISEHSIAHVFGDETSIALDQFRATAMIVGDDFPQILGIEPRRKRGGTHQVAEHNGELAALSRDRTHLGCSVGGCNIRTRCVRPTQLGDGLADA